MTLFVDTNVLVYSADPGMGQKHERARAWLEHMSGEPSGRLSYQVLQEYYVTVTRKLTPPMDPGEARDDVRGLLAWDPVVIDGPVLESAWGVQDRFGLSFWDALIVAAAKAAGCERLLTEDLQDGQDLDGVVVVDPFAHDPPDAHGAGG